MQMWLICSDLCVALTEFLKAKVLQCMKMCVTNAMGILSSDYKSYCANRAKYYIVVE